MDSQTPVQTDVPPFGAIARALARGRVVPFLGAGVNIRVTDAESEPAGKDRARLPSGSQLSRELAMLSSFPSESDAELADLARVASFYVENSGRGNLLELLHEKFNQDYAFGTVHEYLAELPKPLLIVTTNYDDLTERAFRAKGRPYDLVVHPTDRSDMAGAVLWWKHGATEPIAEAPNTLPMKERLKSTTVIYKMHGTVVRPWLKGPGADVDDELPYRDDSYVITEEDYIDFIHRMTQQAAVPAQFMDYFSTRQFLFLGYGLRDWNLRVILKHMNAVLKLQAVARKEQGDDPSWAIQFNPSRLEAKLWKWRNIDIYNMDISQFVEELRKFQIAA